jgi:hypothetical protein
MRVACTLAIVLLTVTPGRSQVYSVGPHGGPLVTLRTDEQAWLLGPWTNSYGLLQYRERTSETAPWKRVTVLCFAGPRVVVSGAAVRASSVGVFTASSLALLVVGFWSRMRRNHQ